MCSLDSEICYFNEIFKNHYSQKKIDPQIFCAIRYIPFTYPLEGGTLRTKSEQKKSKFIAPEKNKYEIQPGFELGFGFKPGSIF